MVKARIGMMLGLVTLALAGPATIATAQEPSDAGAAGAAQHCAVNLDTQQVACDADEAEAQRRAGAEGLFKLATLFDNKGFDGSAGKFKFFGSRRCTPGYDDVDYDVPHLGDVGNGWNDRASSIRTFSRCDVRLYPGVFYDGDPSAWIHVASDLSEVGNGWNNRASSIRMS